MNTKPSTLERLFSCLADYERTTADLAYRLSDLTQDIRMVREEMEQLIDQERYSNNG
jgi:prefoldin subunit 5